MKLKPKRIGSACTRETPMNLEPKRTGRACTHNPPMRLKRFVAGLLACCFLLSGTLTAYADDVNLDNILHQEEGAVGRYSYSGHEWGWIVEVYVATTDTGKLDESKTLTDSSNAAYLGRVAFVDNYSAGSFPALQRPVAIQTNGGGSLPQLTTSIELVNSATSMGFPDPTITGASNMKALFETGQPALQNTLNALSGGNKDSLIAKIANVVSQPVKDKMKAIGNNDAILPGNTTGAECPVEYAFVLTPLEYLRINPGTYSSIGWNEQFWMGANEGAVLNRASIIKAQSELQKFYANTAGSALVGTPLYQAAEAKLKTACTKGELYWFQNLSHRALPDSAFLDHSQFGISTPNRNA